MHWEVLLHPAYSLYLVPSDFYLFSPVKEALGGKRFRADNELKLCVQQWLDKQPQTFLKGYNEVSQVMAMVFRGARRIWTKISITFQRTLTP
jgi:hypothetical protein